MARVLNRISLEERPAVHTPDYPPAQWLINPDMSAVEGVEKRYWKILGDSVIEMDPAEKASVDAARLPALKRAKHAAIDARTSELIAVGFIYDGKTFSMSTHAQLRLMGINQVRGHRDVGYPIRWNTIDDSGVYEVPDATALETMYLTAMGTYRTHVDAGTVLKDPVRGAVSVADLAAVTDPR